MLRSAPGWGQGRRREAAVGQRRRECSRPGACSGRGLPIQRTWCERGAWATRGVRPPYARRRNPHEREFCAGRDGSRLRYLPSLKRRRLLGAYKRESGAFGAKTRIDAMNEELSLRNGYSHDLRVHQGGGQVKAGRSGDTTPES